ncbi:MAG TPA: DUF6263 family protein [Chitinophagaceae bacterium]|nr:DUF6263 family protein [Chitinophagaceae bacterium]
MKIKILVAITTLALAALAGCKGGSFGEAVDFKFNVAKGTKFTYGITMDMNMNQAVMGQNMKVNSKIAMGYQFEVLDDSAGWKRLSTTISRFAMHMNANGMNMDFDTDEPENDSTGDGSPMEKVGKILGALKGGQFVFTMNGDGQIGEITGIKDITSKILARMPAEDTAIAAQSLEKTFNEESFKQNMQQSFAMYPGKAVKPGDTWTKTMNMISNGMPMKLENTYTLQSVEGDSIKVAVASKITADGLSSIMPGMDISMTGDMKGLNTFNKTSGMPVSGDDNMTIDMKMKMQGQEVPMKMDMKMTMAGKKL